MASSINASTAGVGGVITTADNTGILNIQTAGTTALTVNASQKVGVGTSTMNGTLNLYATSAASMYWQDATTGTAATDGFTITQSGADTYLINRESGTMQFYTNSTERMRIDASGNLLLGTTSANARVVIKCATTNFGGGLQLGQSNFDTRWEYVVGGDGKLYLGYGSATTPAAVGNFATNGTYTATSDIRKKKDITYDFNATEIVMRLKPAMGRMIDDADESPLRPFYIAQDMKEVVPSLVSSLDPDKDAIDPVMGVDYASSIPLLAKMLQEQQIMIQELKAEIDLLKGAK